MDKTQNNRAWFMVLPVLFLVAFSAIIPLMTVVNYAFNDTFGENAFFWVGLEWFQDVLDSDRMWEALQRQLIFSIVILLIEVPLGIAVALCMPKKGIGASVCLVLMALPLLIPWKRGGHHLAGLCPRRHRSAWPHAGQPRDRLQLGQNSTAPG